MKRHKIAVFVSVLFALVLPRTANADVLNRPNHGTLVSIKWKADRIVPDGDYVVNLETEFQFARLTPASIIVTPTDISSVDHTRSIPKGTILAWDSDHKVACEPIRRRGMHSFLCLEDSERSGKFDIVSEIEASGVIRKPHLTMVSYEYLIGAFLAKSPKSIIPVDVANFPSDDPPESIDIEIRYEWQHKFTDAQYSICTSRNLGKRLLSFNHDYIKPLCSPNFIDINVNNLPQTHAVYGFDIRFLKFDDDNTHINLQRIVP